MITSDKLKVLIRVLENDRVLVRDFSSTEFKVLKDLPTALTYVKELYIKEDSSKDGE